MAQRRHSRPSPDFARRHPCVRLLRNPGNRGKGYSVRHGMLEATGDWALFSDADLSSPSKSWKKLIAAVESGAQSQSVRARLVVAGRRPSICFASTPAASSPGDAPDHRPGVSRYPSADSSCFSARPRVDFLAPAAGAVRLRRGGPVRGKILSYRAVEVQSAGMT